MRNGELFEAFKVAFKAARDEAYQRCNGKVPIRQVLDVMIEAAYENLIEVVTADLILKGKIKASPEYPKDKINSREIATKKILDLMGTDMNLIDTKHEYAVGILKRERRTKKL